MAALVFANLSLQRQRDMFDRLFSKVVVRCGTYVTSHTRCRQSMSQTTTIYGPPVNTSIPNVDCTLQTCSLLQGPFTYVPSLGGNAFFAALFGLLIAVQLILGLYYRTVGFTIGMITGLILEMVGYASRIAMHFNPFPSTPFLMYAETVSR